tara:strand:+ start:450 stop:1478 length:1029 start_codon:yes stop_codon:yes gene_type:complete
MRKDKIKKKLKVLLFLNENSQFSKYHYLKLLVQDDIELIGIVTNHNQDLRSRRTKFFSILNFFRRLIDRTYFESKILTLRLRKTLINTDSIRVMRPIKLNMELASEIDLMQPDLIISAGYYRKIPNVILRIPKIGSFNFHPSLLPAYAGGNPWFWVIAKGEKYTGVTIHLMTSVFDAGDIAEQNKIRIDNGITEQKLIYLTTIASINLVPSFIQKCKNGKLGMKPQVLSQRSYFGIVTDIDKKIHWSCNAESIKNLIQACSSGSGAWTQVNNERLWIYQATIGNDILQNINSGMIINIGRKGIEVATSDKILFIKKGIINNSRVGPLDIIKKLELREGDVFN